MLILACIFWGLPSLGKHAPRFNLGYAMFLWGCAFGMLFICQAGPCGKHGIVLIL